MDSAAAEALLAAIERRVMIPRPFLEGALSDAVYEFFGEQFRTEGATGGEPWQPLAPGTPEGLPGILRFRGTLEASLTGRNHPLARRIVTQRTLEIGTNDPKAIEHQLGIGVPKRAIVPEELPIPVIERWAQLTIDYAIGG